MTVDTCMYCDMVIVIGQNNRWWNPRGISCPVSPDGEHRPHPATDLHQ